MDEHGLFKNYIYIYIHTIYIYILIYDDLPI